MTLLDIYKREKPSAICWNLLIYNDSLTTGPLFILNSLIFVDKLLPGHESDKLLWQIHSDYSSLYPQLFSLYDRPTGVFAFNHLWLERRCDIVDKGVLIKHLKGRWYWHITLMVHLSPLRLNISIIALFKSLTSTALKTTVSSWFWLPSFSLYTSHEGAEGCGGHTNT